MCQPTKQTFKLTGLFSATNRFPVYTGLHMVNEYEWSCHEIISDTKTKRLIWMDIIYHFKMPFDKMFPVIFFYVQMEKKLSASEI